MAVGGTGMLSTSNYAARKFGVRAAMPGFIGRKLCPQLVIVPCDFDKYRAASQVVQEVLTRSGNRRRGTDADWCGWGHFVVLVRFNGGQWSWLG